jgi:hypothetical protein
MQFVVFFIVSSQANSIQFVGGIGFRWKEILRTGCSSAAISSRREVIFIGN